MIQQLRIQQFAIIEDLEIEFSDGFTVLTGETGAGKSIVVDAISLLLGDRGSDDWIRAGAQRAEIEVIFSTQGWQVSPQLAEYLDGDKTLIVYRRITRSKGSVVRINGQGVSLKVLRELLGAYVAILGQHQALSLLDQNAARSVLDAALPDAFHKLFEEYRGQYRHYLTLKADWDRYMQDKAEIHQKLSFVEFQLSDIQKPDFQAGEEDALKQVRDRSRNYAQIAEALNAAAGHLDQVAQGVSGVEDCAHRLTKLEETYQFLLDQIQPVGIQIGELHDQLTRKQSELERDAVMDIDDVESRLDLIFQYKTKYQVASLDQLLALKEQLQADYDRLSQLAANESGAQKAIGDRRESLVKLAEKMDLFRQDGAARLSEDIQANLQDLGFASPRFEVHVSHDSDRLTADGASEVAFLFSASQSSLLMPVQKGASGGELSRLMLALFAATVAANPPKVMIFDEIDIGVGGMVGLKIGEKLTQIASGSQVVCVTHLPQIAKFATHHYRVSKSSGANTDHPKMQLLSDAERSDELHRMVGGEAVSELFVGQHSKT